ncbi:integrin alpha-L isoform X1 [Nothobranchius furzeri]|uniref:Integrin alpha-L-like n=2 Tax=Nothobranchius TaxID=28779 RepID=A0A8C6MM05_NOTFU|nr:integrin alpha-D isoform X1 [Nothobranchius furzeri]KAF7225371.1 transcript variant X1 [Nothobranchius furzeri]
MDERRFFYLLLYMMAAAAAISVSSAFNIDVTHSTVHSGEQKDFFGYKVLQFRSSENKGIIITAPLRSNGSGGIFRQAQDKKENWFSPDDLSETNSTFIKHLGLSIAADPTGSQFTVCSPSLVHECHKNSYLNSLCYNITDDLQQVSSFTPLFQKCTKKTVNLVFLFDGSASMTKAEFNKNKDFINEIMINLKNTSIKFAAVQFSLTFRTVFDFKDYDAGKALEKLNKEQHMKSLTNTHGALEFVLKNLFEDPNAGGSPDASKAVVIITDGDPSDTDKNDIVQTYEKKKIIRVVIGVVEGKNVDMAKFSSIASQPHDKNIFEIQKYDGLTGILKSFQNKIFAVEESKATLADDLVNEMSQSGFSTAFYKNTLILGSVGSNSWRGSLHEHQEQDKEQISDSEMKKDSYMGYSLSVGEKSGVPLYFAGAPRFDHMGQVVVFRKDDKKWSTAQRIQEDQIGSYFGAELCSVDINSDGDTDFVLVGAPLFYQPHENKEGRIYIYSLSAKIELEKEFSVMAPSMGRFGSTISSLSDLNGDGLRDVAVGAPLEDENRGAVYIFLGEKRRGIRGTFSQRINGKNFQPEIRFFGQAIDGVIDLGDDELPDIVVGSQGAAVVLRSKPVFNATAQLSFHPGVISTEKIDCVNKKDENLPMVNLTACFEMVEATKSKEAMRLGLNISFTLSLDPSRPKNRAFFLQNEKKVQSLTTTNELRMGKTCFEYPTYMQYCVVDTLSPINIKLNFSQADAGSSGAMLNIDSKNQALMKIPFERQCSKNDTCVAQLTVDLDFLSKTILVTEDNYFNVSVTLANHGDDSYNTTLTMHYPPGLSFSKLEVTKSSRPTLHACYDLEEVLDKTVCGISLPVYRSKSSTTFQSSFRVAKDFEWNDKISLTVTGKSDNSNSSEIDWMTKSIPVQYQIRMALTVNEDTVTYLNFTTDDPAPQNMHVKYKIDNTGFKDFPVNVSILLPTKLEHSFEVISYEVIVQEDKTQCSIQPDLKKHEQSCSPENSCVVIRCDSLILERFSGVELSLVGKVHFKDLRQHAANIAFLKRYTGENGEVKFWSLLKVDYDPKRFVLASHKQEKSSPKNENPQKTGMCKDNDPTIKCTNVRVEFIIPPNKLLIILTGAGLGLLLLIILTVIMWKLGCFKRKTMEYYQEQEDKVSWENGSPANFNPDFSSRMMSISETDKKSDQLPEEKQLLDAEKTNGPLESDIKDSSENVNGSTAESEPQEEEK